jgi:hypothetical protein
MGMFDTLYVNLNLLPITGEEQEFLEKDCSFQTKDFDCDMTEIYITDEGELKINRFEYVEVPKENRPHPNDDGFLGMAGSLKRVNERLETIPYHGIVNFYTYKDKTSFEFFAKFDNGKLDIITGGKEE